MNIPSERIPMLVAAVVCGAFLALLIIMGYHEVPDKNRDLLNTLLGVLATGFTTVVMYYFGSSSSSRAKDETIAAQAGVPIAAPPPPAPAPAPPGP